MSKKKRKPCVHRFIVATQLGEIFCRDCHEKVSVAKLGLKVTVATLPNGTTSVKLSGKNG